MSVFKRWWQKEDLPGIWAVTVCSLIFAIAATMPLTPHDLWFHVRLGQQMVEQRALVTTDVFSYTQSGTAYFNNAWLGELMLYVLWVAGGAPLFVLTRAICVVSFYAIFLWLGWRASGSERWSAWLILLAAIASYPHWQLRPQSFALPMFAVFVAILTSYLTRRRAPLFVLPLLMIVWVNVHGSFVFGWLLCMLAILGEIVQNILTQEEAGPPSRSHVGQLFIWSGLTFCAAFINPQGVGILSTLSDIGSDPSIQSWVLEWLPANIREFPAIVFYVLVLMCLLGALLSRARLHATLVLWAVTFVWLGWSSYRNALWATAVMVPVIALQWSQLSSHVSSQLTSLATRRGARFLFAPVRLAGMRALIGLALVALVLGTFPLIRGMFMGDVLSAWVSADTPVDVVKFMQSQNIQGRVYHEIGAGSYLMWAMWPQQQVFVDSRINLYPASEWRDYFAIANANQGFEEILDKYGVDYVLADAFWQPELIKALEKRNEQWTLIFKGGESSLFRRDVSLAH